MTEFEEVQVPPLSAAEQSRADFLEHFSQFPQDDELWQAAYRAAAAEDGYVNQATADDIPSQDLAAFAERVRSEPSSQARYAMTAGTAPNGKVWFDVLESFSSPQIEEAKRQAFTAVVEERKISHPFGRALDIGIGTGRSARTLEDFADHVVGIDRVPELLEVARRSFGERVQVVVADATQRLPFEDNSFDYIGSAHLLSSFSDSATRHLYAEISRLLKPGGIYVDGAHTWDASGRANTDLLATYRSAKAVLADMIVDTVSGKFDVSFQLTSDELARLLSTLQLHEFPHEVHHPGGAKTQLRYLVKA